MEKQGAAAARGGASPPLRQPSLALSRGTAPGLAPPFRSLIMKRPLYPVESQISVLREPPFHADFSLNGPSSQDPLLPPRPIVDIGPTDSTTARKPTRVSAAGDPQAGAPPKKPKSDSELREGFPHQEGKARESSAGRGRSAMETPSSTNMTAPALAFRHNNELEADGERGEPAALSREVRRLLGARREARGRDEEEAAWEALHNEWSREVHARRNFPTMETGPTDWSF